MAITPARHVTCGFYRVHLLVVMGLSTLTALVALAKPESIPLWPAVTAAVLSYVGSVTWLYEKAKPGVLILYVVAGVGLTGGWLTSGWLTRGPDSESAEPYEIASLLYGLTTPLSGLLLGFTIAAMLLGHWYLNTPTMDLLPLRRLVLLMSTATLARAALCGTGLTLQLTMAGSPESMGELFLPLLALRWLAGLLGVLVLAWMAWQTLKIPNTQSATGILYVAVIGTFVGELAGQLLSVESAYPL